MKYYSLAIAGILCSLVASSGNCSAEPGTSEKPNVIFFLSDDHRNDLLGCAGHPILKTPHIDKLASSGVRFENAFVTTSICAASRASLFTSLVERTHSYTFGQPALAKSLVENSYPTVLRKAGYRTGFVGKFGVNVPSVDREMMFDSYAPLNRNPYFKKQKDGSLRHVTEIAGDRAIEFLKESKAKPFCLSVSFNAAHAEDSDKKDHFPWPKAVDGLYENDPIAPPRHWHPDVFERQPEFLRKSMNRDRWFWRWDTPEKYEHNVRAYYRMISGLDHVIGRVVAELEKLELAKNTVIIFSGDNGYYKGSRGFAGKWSHYEESLRVPLVIFDPRLPEGRRGKIEKRMSLNVDIPATILGYAGVAQPASWHGKSLVPLIEGSAPAEWRNHFFCEHLMNNAKIPKWEGIRGQRYVYARYFEQNPPFEFLHDLEKDPDQLQNLIDDPSYKETLETLRSQSATERDRFTAEKPKDMREKKPRR